MKYLYLLWTLLAAHIGYAQSGMTNSGNLRLHSGSSVSVTGDFGNTSAAQFVNAGSFTVQGNITNNEASMSAGSGTLTLSGSALQQVSGGATLRTNNLVTNNSAGITLNNSLGVSAVHTFSAGNITSSNSSSMLVYENGATYTGAADSRHVNGWVRRTGTSDFSFPVGNGSFLRAIALTGITSSSTFDVRHHMSTTNTGSVQSPIFMVDPNEYWTVNLSSGTGQAVVQLNWNNNKVAFPNWNLSSIRAATYTSGLWTSRGGSASGNVSTTGGISSTSISSFGLVTFGSIGATLPVRLLSVSATRNDDHNLITWSTDQEADVDRYVVERKGEHDFKFFDIGEVPAKNSISIHDYSLQDRLPSAGVVQYRIRSVDKDGSFEYSPIVSVRVVDPGSEMQVLNNPAKNKIQVSIPALLASSYRFDLVDNSGRVVLSGIINVTGRTIYSIYLKNDISKGLYTLRIDNKNYRFINKILID